MWSRNIWFATFSAVILPLFSAMQAQAIPAFTRQHKTECTTCHTIYPELNEYGEAFRKNGFVWAGKLRAGAVQQTTGSDQGAVETSRKGNEGLWLAAIPEVLPVSLTASLDLAYNEHAANNDKLDLSTRSLMLQAGGTFRENVGFYLTYVAYSQGRDDPYAANVPTSNKTDISELFLVWRHALNTPVNLKVGRFRPQLSLWKRSNSLTVAGFAPSAYQVGSSSLSPGIFNSQFSVDETEDALELNSLVGNRVFLAGGIVDRDGQNSKEGYGHISFKVGGADFVGHEPVMDLDSDDIWDFLSVTFGTYAYFGKNASINNGAAQFSNDFYRAGIDLDILYRKLRLRLGGAKGYDANPGFAASEMPTHSLVFASEAEYLYDTNIIGLFRYEYQDDGAGITRRYIPTVAFSPLQNIKLTLEYKYEGISPYNGPGVTNRIAILGAKFSF